MVKINHITINTKNNRISTPSDVQREMYFKLKDIVRNAQTNRGIKLFNDTIFKLTMEEDCYVGTLYTQFNGELVPILSTAGTKEESKKRYVWDTMQELYKKAYNGNIIKMLPMSTPFILDCIFPTAMFNIQATKWTGDFTKCLGWAIMFPDEIM